MKINKTFYLSRDRWIKKPFLALAYHAWLVENGSLTARLQKSYANFSVISTRLAYGKPYYSEAAALNLASTRRALIREVQLCESNQPLVFAHSVLPSKCLRGEWHNLGRLGNQPLGATLFANYNVKRTAFRYKKVYANQALYQAAIKNLGYQPEFLWARRSIFSLKCASIMVTEVFLPKLIKP